MSARSEPLPTLAVACALALGTAVSLGLARFSYALFLPPMRADLGWSYVTAGAMNTANAVGYLAGALVAVWLVQATAATAKIASRMVATRFHWNRFIAESSVIPMPPAPTRPSTADSRTLMSHRNNAIDQKAGLTCGQ